MRIDLAWRVRDTLGAMAFAMAVLALAPPSDAGLRERSVAGAVRSVPAQSAGLPLVAVGLRGAPSDIRDLYRLASAALSAPLPPVRPVARNMPVPLSRPDSGDAGGESAPPGQTPSSGPPDADTVGDTASEQPAGSMVAPIPLPRPTTLLPRRLPSMPVSTGPRRVVAPRAATATVPLAAVMMRVGVTEMGARKGLPLDRASLIGIVHLHDTRQALVRLVGGSVRTVSTGDVIEGWKVSLIGLDALRLTRGGEVQTLVLVSR